MARIAIITNPFHPEKDAEVHQFAGGLTVRGWLENRFPGFKEFERATICLINKRPKLRAEWTEYVIREGDVVEFISCPGTPVQWVQVIILIISLVSVVIATRNRPIAPALSQGNSPQPESVFTLQGMRNQNKLGMPIEVRYGRNRVYPSYGSQPYNKYIDNDQWVYLLFCLGQGEFDVEPGMIEDTPITDFPDVIVEITPPGGQVTLFPDNVITSPEVGTIELKGPNEGSGAVWIEDSPGDPSADPPIDPTGHYAVQTAGPFIANPIGTGANFVEVDLTFPRGLYLSNDTGGLDPLTVSVLIEVQSVDNAGNPTSGWFALPLFTKTLASVTPQRFTVGLDFPPDRYQVRVSRTTDKNMDSRAGNTVQWEALRAFLPNNTDFGNVTMISVKARATNNLNDSSQNRFNWWCTRKLPIYIGGMWSLSNQATRSIVWAWADAIRNLDYGGRYNDSYLDLAVALALDATYTARGEFFDGSFDTQGGLWDVLRAIVLIGRAVPMLNGTRFTIIRDVPRSIPSALFNQENIVKGSWKYEVKLVDQNPYDGVIITYADPLTYKPATVLCCLTGETGDNPEQITLLGCTDRQVAFRMGMYLRARRRFQNRQVTWRTGMEGRIPSFLDYVGVSYDVPRWGAGGLLLASTGAIRIGLADLHVLTLSEPVSFDGVSTYQLLLRRRDGGTLGPFLATAGSNDHEIQVTCLGEQWEDFDFSRASELPIFLFGKSNLWGRGVSVQALAPADDEEVEVVAVNYDDRIFQYDLKEAPVDPNTNGNLPTPVRIPRVQGLIAMRSPNVPNEIIVRWQPLSVAQSYTIQISYDGTVWAGTISTEDTTARFQVPPGKRIYIRVSAVNSGQGAWAYWVDVAPTEITDTTVDYGATPNNVSSVTLTPSFQTIWLQWVNPTNAQVRNIHIYASLTTTPPIAPTFTLFPEVTFQAHNSLGNNETWHYWFKVESVAGKFSTLSTMYSATTSAGVDLADLLGSGLVAPELLSVLPSTGNFDGRLVYLTADDFVGGTFLKAKLYRWTSATSTGKSFWTTAVPTADLSGTIAAGQIAANAVTAGTIAAGAVTATAVGANQIITVSANIANATITNAHIVDLAASKITAGTISASISITAPTINGGTINSATVNSTSGNIAGFVLSTGTMTATVSSNDFIQLRTGAGTQLQIGHTAGYQWTYTGNGIAGTDITKTYNTYEATSGATGGAELRLRDNSGNTNLILVGGNSVGAGRGAIKFRTVLLQENSSGNLLTDGFFESSQSMTAVFMSATAGFIGPGGSITSINAGNISSGTLSNSRLPSTISVTTLVGAGSGITSLDAGNISSGTLTRPINNTFLDTTGTSVDVNNANVRLRVSGTNVIVLNKDTPGIYINGNQVVGVRGTRGAAGLTEVVALLDAWGAWA